MTQTYTGPARIAGAILAAAAAGATVLLALHPSESGATFADVLRNEAANRLINGVVHGGFAALLVIEVMALSVLVLAARKPPGIAGTVLFAFGVIALSGSLIADGVVLPAIAAKYLAVPGKIEFAKSLFVLCSSLIAVLMPTGLILQGSGVAFWGIGLAHDRATRSSGVIGIVCGLAAAGPVAVLGLQPVAVMGAIVSLNIALFALGITAIRGRLQG